MMESAECSTSPAHTIVIDFHPFTIDSSKEFPTGALGNGADSCIGRSTSSPFTDPHDYTTLANQAVHPILCRAAGDFRNILEVSNGKKAVIESELPHHAEILSPVFKNSGHSYEQ
jgi:hypothetical protein